MSNLIPTPIVNKNGVSTTVYKSVDKGSNAVPNNIPSPSLTTPSPVTMTIPPSSVIMRRVRDILHNPFCTTPSSIVAAQLERKLDGYPEDTQEYIVQGFEDNPEDDYFDRMIVSMLDKRYPPETIEDAIFVYNNLPDEWDSITESDDWTDNGFDVDYYLIQKINGARGYAAEGYEFGNEDQSLRYHDQKTQKQVLALVALAYTMEMDSPLSVGLRFDDTSSYIEDGTMVQLVVDHAERYSDIAALITERGATDTDLIRAVLEADTQPLREGTL